MDDNDTTVHPYLLTVCFRNTGWRRVGKSQYLQQVFPLAAIGSQQRIVEQQDIDDEQ